MENFNLSFPIDMIKKEERIVSGIATADNIDKSNDIVDFNASLEAFKNWGGNIREMHAPVAVGKAINYEPIKVKGPDGTEYNAIRVDAYISKGAQNTWEKVLDGTLRAFSIGGKILEKAEVTGKMHNGRSINMIKKYVLGELSLVDNPANAMAVVDIVKMDTSGELDYILSEDFDIEKAGKERLKDPKGGLTAAGRRHFKQTEGANLKPGVKGPANTPEKMRRKGSFLTRFFTNPSGPMKDEKGRPTRLALSAAAWGEPVPQNAQDAAALAAKGRRLLERYAKVKNKSVSDILEEDNEVLNKEMDYFMSDEYENILKEGEVTTGGMDAGIKNPTQGSFKTPTMPQPKRRKKKKMLDEDVKKAEDESSTASALEDLLANVVVFYFAAHRAHWNVQGPDFSEYHELFEEIYADAYSSVDPLAEMIRKLNSFPPELGDMVEDASFEDSSMSSDARALATDLYMKNSMLIGLLKSAFTIANNENEQGVANFIAERIDAHQKWDWQLRASLASNGMGIPEDVEDQEEDMTEEESIDENEIANMLNELLNRYFEVNKNEPSQEEVILEDVNIVKMQENSLQNDVKYDMVLDMNEQESKLSLLKRVVNWLVPDVEENASTKVEVTENTQEEDMDIEVLKDALSAVVDEKLANFATSIKEEVEATVQEKIDSIAKGYEADKAELQQKLEAQEEQVKAFAEAGAIKKSVDPEDDEDGEELTKSASDSVWGNIYLPQGLINALGYKS